MHLHLVFFLGSVQSKDLKRLISKAVKLPTGCRCQFLLAAYLTGCRWPCRYFARCFDDNRSLWCSRRCIFWAQSLVNAEWQKTRFAGIAGVSGCVVFVQRTKKSKLINHQRKLASEVILTATSAFYLFVCRCAKKTWNTTSATTTLPMCCVRVTVLS